MLISVAPSLNAAAKAKRPYSEREQKITLLNIDKTVINHQTITEETAPAILKKLNIATYYAIKCYAQTESKYYDPKFDEIYENFIKKAITFYDSLHLRTTMYQQPVHVDVIYFYIFSRCFPEKAAALLDLTKNLRELLETEGQKGNDINQALTLIVNWRKAIYDGMKAIVEKKE